MYFKDLKKLIVPVLFFGLFVLSTQTVVAQSAINTSISVVPGTLRADEPFSVALTSSDIDLDRAQISWYINDILGLSGVGKIGFSSAAGPVGAALNIRAEITAPNGRIVTKRTTVAAQEIDFLWRAHSYTPPFYLGRSLAPSAGFVSITAMPYMADIDGNIIDPRDLVYTWSQEGVVLGNASGFGKQTIVLENGQIEERPLHLRLKVSSKDNTVASEESVLIPLTEPDILFYENSPLRGVQYQSIMRSADLGGNELVLRAEPYFFSRDDVDNDKLLYKWSMNGSSIEETSVQQKNELILRRSEGEGIANILLEILNDNLPFRIFQKAEKGLNITI